MVKCSLQEENGLHFINQKCTKNEYRIKNYVDYKQIGWQNWWDFQMKFSKIFEVNHLLTADEASLVLGSWDLKYLHGNAERYIVRCCLDKQGHLVAITIGTMDHIHATERYEKAIENWR
jgi:hypothetical protein